jgi:hypothetical protein
MPPSTNLHTAAGCGNGAAAARLLLAGEDIEATDLDGATPLHRAAENGHEAVVRLLVDAASIEERELEATDSFGRTPLHYAAANGEAMASQVLIGAGASPAATDHNGESPLHQAAYYGQAAVAAVLLKADASPDATPTRGTCVGMTPLHIAQRWRHASLVRLLSPASSPPESPAAAPGSTTQCTELIVRRGTAGFECDKHLKVVSVAGLGAADVAKVEVGMLLVRFQGKELVSQGRRRPSWRKLQTQLESFDQPWKFTFIHASADKEYRLQAEAFRKTAEAAAKMADAEKACQSKLDALQARRSRMARIVNPQPEPETEICGDDARLRAAYRNVDRARETARAAHAEKEELLQQLEKAKAREKDAKRGLKAASEHNKQIHKHFESELKRQHEQGGAVLAKLRATEAVLAEAQEEHTRAVAAAAAGRVEATAVPSYWKNRQLGASCCRIGNLRIVTVDGQESQLAKDVMYNSIMPGHASQGRCARHTCGVDMRRFRVTRVERVENVTLWRNYQRQKEALREQMLYNKCSPDMLLRRSESVQQYVGAQQRVLEAEINEFGLWHGTKPDVANTLATAGFDPRVSNRNGLYGAGTYFADSFCKANQYSAANAKGEYCMLYCHVTMGCPYRTNRTHIGLSRPGKPYLEQNNPQTRGQPWDSIFAEVGVANRGSQAHNEYVVYLKDQAYPQYIVWYKEE